MSEQKQRDEQLDALLEQALLDAAAQEADELLQSDEPWEPSLSYQKWEAEFLSAGKQKKAKLPFSRMLRNVACLALVAVLGGGMVLTASPDARADFLRWVRQSSSTQVMYQFQGEAQGTLPVYELTWLPEGFSELERHIDETMETGMIRYENHAKEGISFAWNAIRDGVALSLHTEGQTCTAVEVAGLEGELYESPDGGPCTLAWADEAASVFFHLSSTVPDTEALLNMAESVAIGE